MICACGHCDEEVSEDRMYISGHNLVQYFTDSKHQSMAGKIGGSRGGGGRWLSANPDHQKAAFAAPLKKDPDHQRKAGSIGGKISGPRVIAAHIAADSNYQSEAGKIAGRLAVKSGQIFEASKGKFCWHKHEDGIWRFHRSKAERKKCDKIRPLYPIELFHTNVRIFRNGKGIEVDFVIGILGVKFNKRDPSTWFKVIEYHPHDRNGLTFTQYVTKRLVEYCRVEITCQVEFLEN